MGSEWVDTQRKTYLFGIRYFYNKRPPSYNQISSKNVHLPNLFSSFKSANSEINRIEYFPFSWLRPDVYK
jgi:hypothetical protein